MHGIRLVADTSCTDKRAYRLEVDGVSVDEWLLALEGLASGPQMPGSRRYRLDAHDVLLVEASGRIQIRVSLEVPREARRFAAESVAVQMLRRATALRAARGP
ncbi:MAG: hypothetical protein K1X94_33975 [Sandaracinaceae bacterium]|nr:hypothetical protein [Sandaracinaceae bacterium]